MRKAAEISRPLPLPQRPRRLADLCTLVLCWRTTRLAVMVVMLVFQAGAQRAAYDSVSFIQIVQKRTPSLSWSQPAPIVYGTPLSSLQLDAKASTPGSLSYSPSAGAVLHAGSHDLTASFAPADKLDYAAAAAVASLTVEKAAATVTLGNLRQPYAGTPLAPSVATQPSGLTVSLIYNGSAMPPTAPGSYSVTAEVNDSDYSGFASGTFTIEAATPAVSLTTSTPSMLAGSPVTFQVSIFSAAAIPSGQVAIQDGATVLALFTLANGQASYSTVTLGVGAHSLTANYQGDAHFAPATSAAVGVLILDYKVTAPKTGSGSNPILPGGSGAFPVSVALTAGTAFPLPAQFKVSGLPAGASATLGPEQWQPDGVNSWQLPAGMLVGTPVVTIVTPALGASLRTSPHTPILSSFACGFLLFVSIARWRRRFSTTAWGLLAGISCTAAVLALAGCGSSYGFFHSAPQNNTITVTVTSGTLSRSTTFILTVE